MFPGGPGVSAAGSKAHAVSHPAAEAPSPALELRAPHKCAKQHSELLILSLGLSRTLKANNSGEMLNRQL